MAKTNDDVIVLRPGEFAEFWDVQVPCGETAEFLALHPLPDSTSGAGGFESASIDFWLEDFEDVQVPYDEPAAAVPLKPIVRMPSNGRAKSALTKKKKAKPARRRKS